MADLSKELSKELNKDFACCEDAVSRQAAITLPVIPKEHREYQTFNLDDAYEQGWNDLQKCIEALPSAQPEQRWIPSGEKPPEKGSYLVWMPFASSKHRMTVAEYCGGYWNIKTPISAWMPLPEPYKGE